jgi:hypothetical protein
LKTLPLSRLPKATLQSTLPTSLFHFHNPTFWDYKSEKRREKVLIKWIGFKTRTTILATRKTLILEDILKGQEEQKVPTKF